MSGYTEAEDEPFVKVLPLSVSTGEKHLSEEIAVQVTSVLAPLLVELRSSIALVSGAQHLQSSSAGCSEAEVHESLNDESTCIRREVDYLGSLFAEFSKLRDQHPSRTGPAKIEIGILAAIMAAAGAAASMQSYAAGEKGCWVSSVPAEAAITAAPALTVTPQFEKKSVGETACEVKLQEAVSAEDRWMPWQDLLLPGRARGRRASDMLPTVAAELVSGSPAAEHASSSPRRPCLWPKRGGNEIDDEKVKPTFKKRTFPAAQLMSETPEAVAASACKSTGCLGLQEQAYAEDKLHTFSKELSTRDFSLECSEDFHLGPAKGASKNGVHQVLLTADSDNLTGSINKDGVCATQGTSGAAAMPANRLPHLRRPAARYPPPLLVSPVSLAAGSAVHQRLGREFPVQAPDLGWGNEGLDVTGLPNEERGWA